MFSIPAKQKKQSLKTLSSKSSSYPMDGISIKEMLYDPYLVSKGLEEEDDNDEDASVEDYWNYEEDLSHDNVHRVVM